MQKHGLINDLKKLDSFNKFIEQHSSNQEKQNSVSFFENNNDHKSIDSLQSPSVLQAKFRRMGSGDLCTYFSPCDNSRQPQINKEV
jgi:hypothetical protein